MLTPNPVLTLPMSINMFYVVESFTKNDMEEGGGGVYGLYKTWKLCSSSRSLRYECVSERNCECHDNNGSKHYLSLPTLLTSVSVTKD